MKTQKQINDDLRDDLQAGYNREFDLQDELLLAQQEIMCLVAANVLLKIKLRRLH